MTRTRTEPDTIKCECCQGKGGWRGFDPYHQTEIEVECELCDGTGREPIDTKARRHVEGSSNG